jgi:hypothetical protein
MKDGSLNVSIDAEWKENLKIINSDKVFDNSAGNLHKNLMKRSKRHQV